MKTLSLTIQTPILIAIAALMYIASSDVSYSQSLYTTSNSQGNNPPKTWVDADTGHRITRLTDDPGSVGLYFNARAYTPDGLDMIYKSKSGIAILNLATDRAHIIVPGPVRDIVVGTKTRRVFFMKPGSSTLYAVNVDSGDRSTIANLPSRASIDTINANETLAAGTYIEGDEDDFSDIQVDSSIRETAVKATKAEIRLNAHIPMVLFTVDLRSGTTSQLLYSTDWLNHLLFSPTDSTLLMYCHEGSWDKVDRIWTIRIDGQSNKLIHKRSMNGEIAGHEFWGNDGKTIWYDLQRPRGQAFYLASYDVETGVRQWIHLERDQWSIHFNVSSDGLLFCGDGGDYLQVAKSHDGEWIELFRPSVVEGINPTNTSDMIHTGTVTSSHLVNLSKQNWKLEPNVRFSPDHKYVVFTSNMFGDSYIFAVEI